MPYVARLPSAGPRIARLKTELAALGAVTEVGFAEGGAAVARLQALAAELEALNPTRAPARAQSLLKGRWHLLYSSLGLLRETTLARLGFGQLPRTPVTVVEVFQETDPARQTYDNIVQFVDEGGEAGTLVIEGGFLVVDDEQMELRFDRARLVSPRGRVVFPLDPVKLPPIAARVSYLDEGFRLVRGANGSLYMLERLDPQPAHWAREA
ncbi:MAG: PAP/fibrillin family protein [Sphingomonadaceae bacterium]